MAMKKLGEYKNAWLVETEEEAGALVHGDGFCFVLSHEANKVHKQPEVVSVFPVACAKPVLGTELWSVGFFAMHKEVSNWTNSYIEVLSTGQEVYCTTELLEKVTKKGGKA